MDSWHAFVDLKISTSIVRKELQVLVVKKVIGSGWMWSTSIPSSESSRLEALVVPLLHDNGGRSQGLNISSCRLRRQIGL